MSDFEQENASLRQELGDGRKSRAITCAAENAESSLGIPHRKNQYAITL
jgi:hypothetical protein